jgi:CheY-like chemotaxis protein
LNVSGPLTVLIVDDYQDALDVWELFLRAEGFAVLTAANGPDALAHATVSVPDMIVMDIQLPGLSGLEVARELRRNVSTRHIPLIAATGRSLATQLDEVRGAGFDAVIVKPCDPDVLLAEIRRLLAGAEPRPATPHSS